MKNISDRLRKFAEYFGSIKDLAEALDMKPPAFQSYLSGRSVPGSNILVKLNSLGCNINWLLTGEGEMLKSEVSAAPSDIQELRNEIYKKDMENKLLKSKIEVLKETIKELKREGFKKGDCCQPKQSARVPKRLPVLPVLVDEKLEALPQ
jgi:hypothetical protein